MNIITFLAFLAGLAVTNAAAVATPNGIVVTKYPNGLPPGLYPRTELTSRAVGLEKRDPQIVVGGTVVDVQAPQPVVLFGCSEKNFTGFCVRITSAQGQCVEAVSPTSPSNDNTTSIGPDRPWKCRVFVNFRCDESEGAFNVEFPGIPDLNVTGFDNKVSSYRCI